jgi:hypothetical protein
MRLMAEAQRVIDQLQNDPNLVDMTRVPSDHPIESRGGPSDPESIQIEEITGSDNAEVSTPPVGSPRNVLTQPGIEKMTRRASTPNPLFDLITIYDDEESPKVSLVTTVKITKEMEPEKEYARVPWILSHSTHRNPNGQLKG